MLSPLGRAGGLIEDRIGAAAPEIGEGSPSSVSDCSKCSSGQKAVRSRFASMVAGPCSPLHGRRTTLRVRQGGCFFNQSLEASTAPKSCCLAGRVNTALSHPPTAFILSLTSFICCLSHRSSPPNNHSLHRLARRAQSVALDTPLSISSIASPPSSSW